MMILEGRVEVNGSVVREVALRVNPDRDVIKIDGIRAIPPCQYTYLIIHKPRGYACSAHSFKNQKSIYTLLRNHRSSSLKYAGRLDLDSEGLLLFTDDGELVYRLTHPRYKTSKLYLVKTSGVPDRHDLSVLRKGVMLSDGITRPCNVTIINKVRTGAWLRVELFEGRKRQLRRMFDTIDHSVERLKRVSIGPVRLGNLAQGKTRRLTDREVMNLRQSVGLISSIP